MNVIRAGRKCTHLNTSKTYRIYKIIRDILHMNDIYINTYIQYFRHYTNITTDSSTHPQERYVSRNNYTERPYRSKET
jgi:hypothetical protein